MGSCKSQRLFKILNSNPLSNSTMLALSAAHSWLSEPGREGKIQVMVLQKKKKKNQHLLSLNANAFHKWQQFHARAWSHWSQWTSSSFWMRTRGAQIGSDWTEASKRWDGNLRTWLLRIQSSTPSTTSVCVLNTSTRWRITWKVGFHCQMRIKPSQARFLPTGLSEAMIEHILIPNLFLHLSPPPLPRATHRPALSFPSMLSLLLLWPCFISHSSSTQQPEWSFQKDKLKI